MGGEAAAFPQTRWTAILSAKDSADPASHENLDYLIRLYWKPVYRFVRLGWSKTNEEAKDLTQDFFASLIARESLKEVSPDKGRFRSFLKAALKNFLMQEKRDAGRRKRGGDAKRIDLDWAEYDPADDRASTPEEAFDKEWASTLLDLSLKGLKEKLAAEGKETHFRLFEKFYFGTGEQLSYEQLAEEFGLKRFDVGNYLKTARVKFRAVAMELIGEYVTGESEREREFAELFGGGL
jgi:RNA polymerase sigma-70 factor (ECF subfamily)